MNWKEKCRYSFLFLDRQSTVFWSILLLHLKLRGTLDENDHGTPPLTEIYPLYKFVYEKDKRPTGSPGQYI